MLSYMRLALFTTLAALNGPFAATAQDVRGAGPDRISLEVGQAKFVRLDSPASAIFLSNPAAAEIDLQSARYVYIVGKQIGETNLFVLGENDEEVYSATLNVSVDTAKLTRAANRSVNGGRVQVTAVDGAVFLSGQVKTNDDAATVQDVVSGLLTPDTMVVSRLTLEALAQVNLQVRVAEVSRSITDDLGISFSSSSRNVPRSFSAPKTDVGGFEINLSSNNRNINVMLDALSRKGLVSILSEPNLTARSGESASFLAGGQVPYATRNSDGEVTYEMQPIGVELDFKPTVHANNQIQLELTTRVRDVDPSTSSNTDAPALTERSATTTVELGSGESFAIAGMFQANTAQSLSGLPGISKLPILGMLFRSSKFARGETEMVIIVTPYLVKPGRPDQFETPVDRLRPVSSGLEQAITGQLTRKPLRPGATGNSRVRNGGFLLE